MKLTVDAAKNIVPLFMVIKSEIMSYRQYKRMLLGSNMQPSITNNSVAMPDPVKPHIPEMQAI
jgi:hypothetical protein